MSGEAYLVFRRFGSLWALPAHRVTAVASGPVKEIHLAHATITADEVVGIITDLHRVRPGPTFRSLWPHPCEGIGVLGSQPAVVLASDTLPALLLKGEA